MEILFLWTTAAKKLNPVSDCNNNKNNFMVRFSKNFFSVPSSLFRLRNIKMPKKQDRKSFALPQIFFSLSFFVRTFLRLINFRMKSFCLPIIIIFVLLSFQHQAARNLFEVFKRYRCNGGWFWTHSKNTFYMLGRK